MADLNKYIAEIANITNYKIKSKNYAQEGRSGFIWAGECASTCLNDINLLKAQDVRRGNNLSIYSIINQMNIFKDAVNLQSNLEHAMQSLIKAEELYARDLESYRTDPDFPRNLLDFSREQVTKQKESLRKTRNEIEQKLRGIVSMHVSSPERNAGEVIEYYIDIPAVNTQVVDVLKKLSNELELTKTELNGIRVEDTLVVNTKSSTIYYSRYKERLQSNIDKLINKIQNIIGKIESHINKITDYENGVTAEKAESENAFQPTPYVNETTDGVQASTNPAEVDNSNNTYTVKPGDSLAKIAAKYGISWQELYNANKDVIGSNPSLINAGLALTIPGVAASGGVVGNTKDSNQNSGGGATNPSSTSNSNSNGPKDDLTGSTVNDSSSTSQTPKIFDDIEDDNVSPSVLTTQIPSDIAKRLDKKLGNGFSAKVEEVAKNINCDPNDLLGVMYSESGINPSSGSSSNTSPVGLIQFIPNTVKQLGTTREKVLAMSAVEQLDLVEECIINNDYYNKGKYKDAGDLYSIVITPGRANKEVLITKADSYYGNNRGLDINKDGQITKTELANRIDNKYKEMENNF